MSNPYEIDLFSEFSREEEESLGKLITWQNIPKSKILISNNDNTNEVFFIGSGSVRATIYSFSGKEVAYQDLHKGQIFGELSAIDNLPRTTSIMTLSDCVIGKMKAADFWDILEEHPSVMKKTMERLTGVIRFLVGRVYEYSALDVKDRIRAEIVRHGRENMVSNNSAVVEDFPTHENLANKLSTHREAVTKEFSQLAKNGLIEKSGKKITIPNIEKLQNLIVENI